MNGPIKVFKRRFAKCPAFPASHHPPLEHRRIRTHEYCTRSPQKRHSNKQEERRWFMPALRAGGSKVIFIILLLYFGVKQNSVEKRLNLDHNGDDHRLALGVLVKELGEVVAELALHVLPVQRLCRDVALK